jgi:hypothetical protein
MVSRDCRPESRFGTQAPPLGRFVHCTGHRAPNGRDCVRSDAISCSHALAQRRRVLTLVPADTKPGPGRIRRPGPRRPARSLGLPGRPASPRCRPRSPGRGAPRRAGPNAVRREAAVYPARARSHSHCTAPRGPGTTPLPLLRAARLAQASAAPVSRAPVQRDHPGVVLRRPAGRSRERFADRARGHFRMITTSAIAAAAANAVTDSIERHPIAHPDGSSCFSGGCRATWTATGLVDLSAPGRARPAPLSAFSCAHALNLWVIVLR